ncbi:MAG: putative PEP-binding protein [Pseudonocardiales bacterium]
MCGEHAGDPTSVEYLVSLGVDSLSCSPRRVPLTRFSAGRAALLRSIAGQLHLSVRTVDNYLGRIFTKLGAAKRSELAGLLKYVR